MDNAISSGQAKDPVLGPFRPHFPLKRGPFVRKKWAHRKEKIVIDQVGPRGYGVGGPFEKISVSW